MKKSPKKSSLLHFLSKFKNYRKNAENFASQPSPDIFTHNVTLPFV